MFSRSIFMRIDKLTPKSITEAEKINMYLESYICYLIKKIQTDNCYNFVASYRYSTYKIDNSFTIAEELLKEFEELSKEMRDKLTSYLLYDTIIKNTEQAMHEANIFNLTEKCSLNINSMLVNCDSILITYEVFKN